MKIPVFHDDQHGTAIIVAAAILNGLKLVGKDIGEVKFAGSGRGAAALACINLLVSLGLKRENIFISDIKGVVYEGRTELMDEYKAIYAQPTSARTLAEILVGADIFLGLSAGGILKPEMLQAMAPKPIIMALANPEPEIRPERRKASPARGDHLHWPLGLSEPGQQRPLLPLHFPRRARCRRRWHHRGNETRRRQRHRGVGRAEASEVVAKAYGGRGLEFGRTI